MPCTIKRKQNATIISESDEGAKQLVQSFLLPGSPQLVQFDMGDESSPGERVQAYSRLLKVD